MKKNLLLLSLIWFITHANASADKLPKYKAIIKVFPLGTVEGYIYVNLYQENKDKIKIDVIKAVGEASSFAQPNSTVEVLAQGIAEFVVDSTTYQFKRLYDGKKAIRNYCVSLANKAGTTYRLLATDTASYVLMDIQKEDYQTEQNCFVKKIYGLDTLGIYQLGTTWNPDLAVVVVHRKSVMGGCTFISNKYFTNSEVWKGILFRSCPELAANARENKEGWAMTAAMSNEEKIAVWKKYIDAWVQCKNNNH